MDENACDLATLANSLYALWDFFKFLMHRVVNKTTLHFAFHVNYNEARGLPISDCNLDYFPTLNFLGTIFPIQSGFP